MIKDVQRGKTHTEAIDFIMETCCNCCIPFFMPRYKKNELVKSHDLFYCPNGHAQHYSGKSAQEKEIDDLQRKLTEQLSHNEIIQNRLLDELNKRQQAEAKLKRVSGGVCPCCNRTFKNLAAHMKTKHSK